MQEDVRLRYREVLEDSHQGRTSVVRTIHTGNRGRPLIEIDPDFLRWASRLRSTSAIARFLSVSRERVRQELLHLGLAQPLENPFAASTTDDDADDLLDPHAPANIAHHLISYTGPLSQLTDDELDTIIADLKKRFVRAGISMIDGLLRGMSIRVPRTRIRDSLLRIDPVHRVFERITIRRRTYSVPGPNSLWHHDGQHGLIRYGIVIHGFIDGYSRLITALRAHNNNAADTVLRLFIDGSQQYGVPSRVRGDHGLENLYVAAFMEAFRGDRRGSYIWGR